MMKLNLRVSLIVSISPVKSSRGILEARSIDSFKHCDLLSQSDETLAISTWILKLDRDRCLHASCRMPLLLHLLLCVLSL